MKIFIAVLLLFCFNLSADPEKSFNAGMKASGLQDKYDKDKLDHRDMDGKLSDAARDLGREHAERAFGGNDSKESSKSDKTDRPKKDDD